MRIPGTAVFVFVSLLAWSPVWGQMPQQAPRRDPRSPQQPRTTGTGVLRGRVVDGQTGQPLVHARVRLNGLGGPQMTTISTDATGVFEFAKLPPGRYSFWAYKGGYGQAFYPEISQTIRSARLPIALTDGQVVDNIRIALYRGSAIVGHIVDSYGDPIESVSVQVLAAPGSGTPRNASAGMANDAGEFRIARLPPGAYLVVATNNGSRAINDGTEATALAPTYYPGVLSPDQAQVVTVERGQTVTGIDFQMIEQPVAVVTGLVTDSAGQPAASGSVHVTSLANFATPWNTGGPVRPDGSFEVRLPPGSYRIDAWAQRRDPAKQASVSFGRPSDEVPSQQGFANITVGAEPLNLVIAAGDGGTISGRLVFDGEGQPPDPTRISVMAMTARDVDSGFGCRAQQGKVNPADLTFTIDGVYGSCLLNVQVAAGGMGRWLLRSAMYRDVDLLDRPVELTNLQHVKDVPIVMTTRRGELSAEVTDEQGAPTQDYVLFAFSTDKSRWSLPRYQGTALKYASPQAQLQSAAPTMPEPNTAATVPRLRGVINWLPPGDYYVVALDDIGVEDLRDPAYFEQLVPHATRATVRENEAQALQLHRLKAPPSITTRAPR